MEDLNRPTSASHETDPETDGLPPGDHPLEVAARKGIGPLSPLAKDVWHGRSKPCVSCGQIVARDAEECTYCGQDLSEGMIERMRAHAGPWYVLEHLRPFPGVSLERVVLQIRRGVLTETSIIRGPTTDFQWRFAVETPGICRYFGRCWNCHEEITPSDSYCPACLSNLLEQEAGPRATEPPHTTRERFTAKEVTHGTALSPKLTSKLQELSDAVGNAKVPTHKTTRAAPVRIAGLPVVFVILALLAVAILILIWATHLRG